jgi:hypothetical protein
MPSPMCGLCTLSTVAPVRTGSVQTPLQGSEDRPSGMGATDLLAVGAIESFTAGSGGSQQQHLHGPTYMPSPPLYGNGVRSSAASVPGRALSRHGTIEGRRASSTSVFADQQIQRMMSSRSNNNMMEEPEQEVSWCGRWCTCIVSERAEVGALASTKEKDFSTMPVLLGKS